MSLIFSKKVSASEILHIIQQRDSALAERNMYKEQLSKSVSASDMLKFFQERESAWTERDSLRLQGVKASDETPSEVAALQQERDRLQSEVDRLRAVIAAIPKPGSDEYDLPAAQRLRDRMERIQPFFPISTSGVFSFSQHQQELFAFETLGFKKNGFFLEIGVGPGDNYSNTYMLEKYFGWDGILCEPNPNYFESIKKRRSVILDTRAAYSKTGDTVRFLCVPGIYGLLSTISEFTKSDQHNRYGEEVEVQTVTLEDLLTQHNAPVNIDYISLDTEGSEEEIIGNFDFNKWNVSILTIEHNLVPGRTEKFDKILLPFGYKRVHEDISGGDAWYLKQK